MATVAPAAKAINITLTDRSGIFSAPLGQQVRDYQERDRASDPKELKANLHKNAATLRSIAELLPSLTAIFLEIRSKYCVETNPAEAKVDSLSLCNTISAISPTFFGDTSQKARYAETCDKVKQLAQQLIPVETETLPYENSFSTRQSQEITTQFAKEMAYGPRESGHNISVGQAEKSVENTTRLINEQAQRADKLGLEVHNLFLQARTTEKGKRESKALDSNGLNLQATYIKRVAELVKSGISQERAELQATQEQYTSSTTSLASDATTTFAMQVSHEQALLKLIIDFKRDQDPKTFEKIIDKVGEQDIYWVIASSMATENPALVTHMERAYVNKGWEPQTLTEGLAAVQVTEGLEVVQATTDFPPAPQEPTQLELATDAQISEGEVSEGEVSETDDDWESDAISDTDDENNTSTVS